MVVVVNDEPKTLAEGRTLAEALDDLGVGAKGVVVERNGEPVFWRELATTKLVDGDRLYVLRARAGG